MSTTTPNAAELAATYDCPNDGVPKRERRTELRPKHDIAAEELFNGFANVIGNLRREHYWQGYVTAMRDSFARFQRTQAARIAELESAIDRELAGMEMTLANFQTPTVAIRTAINWHVAVALDPAVSSDAQALIDSGAALAQQVPEPQSAGVVETLRPIIGKFPELNPSNYDHGDACALNAWGVELVLAWNAAIAATEAAQACSASQQEPDEASMYRFIRSLHWSDSPMAVVMNPKEAVKLGHWCPFGDLLDTEVKRLMKEKT